MRPRTLGARSRLLVAGALALTLLLVPASADAKRAAPAKRAPAKPTVASALQGLQRSGTLSATLYAQYASTYTRATSTLAKLSGTRRAELGAVLANVQQIAAAGAFIPSRLPALFLTLERNLQWWANQPLLGADQRVSIPGSRIVWEYYPGQGIEIQWLATFGEANGYYLQGHENTQLQEVLNEVIPLATQRAGGIAWEYMFHFDGGAPPWTSGLSQGTALQALARAYSRLKTPAYLTAAQQALGLFQTPPPVGVRVATPAGARYAEYTYAPSDRILNGFIQSLNGLYDYAKLTGDPLGRQLFEAGDAAARSEVPAYDTGAWSKYDQYTESNLNYHELLAEFLQDLCTRTDEGPPVPAAPKAPAPPPAATTPTGTTTAPPTTTTTTTGATAATAARVGATAGAAQASAAIPGDAIYCSTAQRFTSDLHTPPAIALLTRTLPAGARGGVQLLLSKVATVSLSVSRGGHLVWSNSALVEGGKPRLLWITPTKAGAYAVTLHAVDLAGNSASTTGTIVLRAHRG
ncbi:MAG TPA: D-glucuronyl C5-epimerase family protein [Solirubrobacteraceae bacterium]|nr:D-glucuronyl C5-epimerase family protein [Solirubrobacteraceae bacterium]